MGVWCVAPPYDYSSNQSDQRSLITIANVIIMKYLKFCENYRKVTQRHRVGKGCWKMVPIELLDAGLPQTFNLWKNAIWGSTTKGNSFIAYNGSWHHWMSLVQCWPWVSVFSPNYIHGERCEDQWVLQARKILGGGITKICKTGGYILEFMIVNIQILDCVSRCPLNKNCWLWQ